MRERLMILGVVWLGLILPLVPSIARGQTAAGTKGQSAGASRGDRKSSLRMTPGIVCRTIRGYEDYQVLPKASQTSDEKLLVYFRPLGFQTELVDGAYQAHLVPDFQIRKRGEKGVLLQKLKMYEYKPRGDQPPRNLYMKNVISLKGLTPGDYDLTARHAGHPVSRDCPRRSRDRGESHPVQGKTRRAVTGFNVV
jgi:hypothetical protein